MGSLMPHHRYLPCKVCLSHKKFKSIMFIGKLHPNCKNISMILTSLSDKQAGETKILIWCGENKENSMEPVDHEAGIAFLIFKSLGINPMSNRKWKFKNLCLPNKAVIEGINQWMSGSLNWLLKPLRKYWFPVWPSCCPSSYTGQRGTEPRSLGFQTKYKQSFPNEEGTARGKTVTQHTARQMPGITGEKLNS